MDRVSLYTIAFFTNAAILVFEIAGGRLLAPYIGTTVGVWAGLIAVVLGGMALGYHYGGRLADKNASRERIGLVLFGAGATALLSWSVRDSLPELFQVTQMSPTVGALVIGTALFMPTVFLLAAISPMLAKNLIERLESTGKTVGELNAVGTGGAIVGAVATGMFLIPYFGVSTIMLGVAIPTLLLGVVLARKYILKLAGVTALSLLVAFLLNTPTNEARGWVADISSAYNRIIITEEDAGGDTLALWTSPFGIQCQMYVNAEGQADETRLVGAYQKAHALVIAHFFPEGPARGLFLGGCIGAFPRHLSLLYPNMESDVVEIDPEITEVARNYFSFDATKFPLMSIFHEDARVYVNREHEPYDVLHMDAFGSAGRVPFHLMTKEMFERLKENMREDGIVIVNVHGAYEGGGLLYPAVYAKTANSVFKTVAVYQFTDSPNMPQNLVLVASETRVLPEKIESGSLILKRVTTPENVIVLTDDYAPVEGLSREKLLSE